MIVRPERSADFAAIAALVRAAFDSPVQPKLVDDLRDSPGYLPELALVAEDDEPVGHVMFTHHRARERHDDPDVVAARRASGPAA